MKKDAPFDIKVQPDKSKVDLTPGRNSDNTTVPRAAQCGESTSLNENDER